MHFAKAEFLNLSRCRQRECINDADKTWNLETSQPIAAKVPHLFGVNGSTRLRLHRRRHFLAEELTLDCVYRGIHDRGMTAEHVLHILRRDVLATADDDVLDAAGDAHAAVVVD